MRPILRLIVLICTLHATLTTGYSQRQPVSQWLVQSGSTESDYAQAVCVSKSNEIYTAGNFQDTATFNLANGPDTLISRGNRDIVIHKTDSLGNTLWLFSIGGTLADHGQGIITDNDGNVYVTGSFQDQVDFDPGPGTAIKTSRGSYDIFIAKYTSNGSYLWVDAFGSTDWDYVESIIIGHDSSLYVCGGFQGSINFDTSTSTYINSAGSKDIYFQKRSLNGTHVWTKTCGGTAWDQATEIRQDDQNCLYISGYTFGTIDMDPGSGTRTLSTHGDYDVVIAKYSPNGDLLWAHNLGGSGADICYAVAIDDSANLYITGIYTTAVDFDPSGANQTLTSSGLRDVFIVKYDSSCGFIWGCTIGGNSVEVGEAIEIAENGDVAVGGMFRSTTDFDPGGSTAILTTGNLLTPFILKLDRNMNFIWVKALMGSDDDEVNDMAVGLGSDIYVTGGFTSLDFKPGDGLDTFSAIGNSGNDIYTIKIIECTKDTVSFFANGCGSYTSPSQRYVWSNPGTYIDTLINQYGCDSIIRIILTITPIPTKTVAVSACDSFIAPYSGNIYYFAGTYYDIIPNANGCDTALTINLKLYKSSQQTRTVSACDSILSPSGQTYYRQSGTYSDTLKRVTGCDSIVISNVTITQSAFSLDSVTSCNVLVSPSGKYVFSSTGTYYDTLVRCNGCDSIIQLTYTRLHNDEEWDTVSSCDPYPSPSQRFLWETSGSYSDTLVNRFGCDSILRIYYTRLSNSMVDDTVASCSPYLSPSQRFTWTSTGSYSDTLLNQLGCDSIVRIWFVRLLKDSSFSTDTLCSAFISPSGKYIWTQSGYYTDTLSNSHGCDSVLHFVLYFPLANAHVYQSGNHLAVFPQSDTYQWLDCTNAYVPVTGEDDSIFYPTVSGNFAVKLSLDGCTDTTDCQPFVPNSLLDGTQSSVRAYPNPVSTHLSFEGTPDIFSYRIVSSDGRLMQSGIGSKTISCIYFPPGMYHIQLYSAAAHIGSLIFIKE